MKNQPISLVCISYNTADEVEKFVHRVEKCSLIKHVFLIDNCSNDYNKRKNKSLMSDFVTIIENDKNYGFDYANNVGLKYVCENLNEEWVCIANTDIIFDDDVIEQLLNKIKSIKQIGVMAPMMINAADGSIVKSPRDFPTYRSLLRDSFYLLRRRFLKKSADNYKKTILDGVEIVDAVSGGFMMFRSEAIKKCQYFDANIFMYYDEDALCSRLKSAGYLTGYYTDVKIVHDHDFSKKKYVDTTVISSRSARYFMRTYVKPGLLKYWFYVFFNICHILEMKLIIFGKKIFKGRKK